MPEQLKWPGYRQDGEDQRKRAERQREEQIKARNLSDRIRSADPAQRHRIDPATGRTFGDARSRGMYDDAQRLKDSREMNDRRQRERQDIRRRLGRLSALGRAGEQAMARDRRDRPSQQPRGPVPSRPQPDRTGPLGRKDALERALAQSLARERAQARLQGRRGRN